MSVLRLEEISAPALDALDRARTLVIVPVSPLEQHGPHLPVGVDYLAARHFAEAIGERIAARRPGWTVLLSPTLPLGSFAFEAVGTIGVRQRVVRDAVVGLRPGAGAGRVPLHPRRQRPRRSRAPGRAGGGLRDRVPPSPRGDGLVHGAHGVGVPPRPLSDRGSRRRSGAR